MSGTQLVAELPGRTRDGVAGFWYGKAPGLDRAADAIRHANVSGTAHLGGAVALIGDDPVCKSSTLPSSCELMAESLVLPLFSPAGVGDIVRLGLHAVALSRAAGLWTAMKIVSDVADASASVDLSELSELRSAIPAPPAESRGAPPMLLGPELGRRRARPDGRPPRRRPGIRPRSPAQPDRVRAQRAPLRARRPGPGVRDPAPRAVAAGDRRSDELEAMGIRLVALELVWPLHRDDVRAFADGVQELIVIEDKRPFVERQLRDLLYGVPGAPPVLGKHDADGPGADRAGRHGRRRRRGAGAGPPLGRPTDRRGSRERVQETSLRVRQVPPALPMARTPFFCSGCPHNLSTRTPEDQLVGAGIGCHALIWVDTSRPARPAARGAPDGRRGRPVERDGAVHQRRPLRAEHRRRHVSSLGLAGDPRPRWPRKVNITYRLLYNDAIAMTGGQAAPGRLGVVELTHWLAIEGVKRVIVTTEDPGVAGRRGAAERRHGPPSRRPRRGPGRAARRRRRDRAAAHRSLRDRGAAAAQARQAADARAARVDQRARVRRLRRLRAQVDLPVGDPGRDRTGSQDADPPVLLHPGSGLPGGRLPVVRARHPRRGRRPRRATGRCPRRRSTPPAPEPAFDADRTVADPHARDRRQRRRHRLADPADGGRARGTLVGGPRPDRAWRRRAGRSISDVRLGPEPEAGAPRAAGGEVDLLLGLDLLGAVAPDTLRTLDPQRTIAVVNLHETATAQMVSDTGAALPPLGRPRRADRGIHARRPGAVPGRRRRSPRRCSPITCRPT